VGASTGGGDSGAGFRNVFEGSASSMSKRSHSRASSTGGGTFGEVIDVFAFGDSEQASFIHVEFASQKNSKAKAKTHLIQHHSHTEQHDNRLPRRVNSGSP
jgi:hypothetical protein